MLACHGEKWYVSNEKKEAIKLRGIYSSVKVLKWRVNTLTTDNTMFTPILLGSVVHRPRHGPDPAELQLGTLPDFQLKHSRSSIELSVHNVVCTQRCLYTTFTDNLALYGYTLRSNFDVDATCGPLVLQTHP